MFILTENNVVAYLKERTNLLEGAQQISVKDFNHGGSESGSGDGYVNFVFCVNYCVRGEELSLVLKQARARFKNIAVEGDTGRNKLEYEGIRLKRGLIPEYLPKLYFKDQINNIFVMESFEDWRILRYQFNKKKRPPNLSRKIAEFLAVSNFYTSEIYLDTSVFRDLTSSFINCEMRRIIENGIFLPEFLPLGEGINPQTDPAIYALSRNIWEDKEVVSQCYLMRDIFMHKGECLIHGDFHTSNIFVKQDQMKVIDMEYAFVGPYSYDMGYLFNNYISQFSASFFKPMEQKEESETFGEYMLDSMKDIYLSYVEIFDSLWDHFGKVAYTHSREYRQELYASILQEVLGFAAVANISRITVLTGFPDFDVIVDREKHVHAKRLSLIISQHLLKNRKKYGNIHLVLEDIRKISDIYRAHME